MREGASHQETNLDKILVIRARLRPTNARIENSLTVVCICELPGVASIIYWLLVLKRSWSGKTGR